MDLAAIGTRVKAAREAMGWSLRQLAAKSGMSHSYIERLEKAVTQKVSVADLARVAGALGVELEEFTAVDDGMATPPDYSDVAFLNFRREWELLPVDQRGLVLELIRAVRVHAVLSIDDDAELAGL